MQEMNSWKVNCDIILRPSIGLLGPAEIYIVSLTTTDLCSKNILNQTLTNFPGKRLYCLFNDNDGFIPLNLFNSNQIEPFLNKLR